MKTFIRKKVFSANKASLVTLSWHGNESQECGFTTEWLTIWSGSALSVPRIITVYRKIPKNLYTKKFVVITRWLYRRVMSSKDQEGIANSVDPDQTPLLLL